MKNKQVVEDLKTLKQYFVEQTGAAPVCLDFAIKAIEQPKCICSSDCTWKQETATRKAKWLRHRADKSHYYYYCSNCGFRSEYQKGNYCSKCGFYMKGEENENK